MICHWLGLSASFETHELRDALLTVLSRKNAYSSLSAFTIRLLSRINVYTRFPGTFRITPVYYQFRFAFHRFNTASSCIRFLPAPVLPPLIPAITAAGIDAEFCLVLSGFVWFCVVLAPMVDVKTSVQRKTRYHWIKRDQHHHYKKYEDLPGFDPQP